MSASLQRSTAKWTYILGFTAILLVTLYLLFSRNLIKARPVSANRQITSRPVQSFGELRLRGTPVSKLTQGPYTSQATQLLSTAKKKLADKKVLRWTSSRKTTRGSLVMTTQTVIRAPDGEYVRSDYSLTSASNKKRSYTVWSTPRGFYAKGQGEALMLPIDAASKGSAEENEPTNYAVSSDEFLNSAAERPLKPASTEVIQPDAVNPDLSLIASKSDIEIAAPVLDQLQKKMSGAGISVSTEQMRERLELKRYSFYVVDPQTADIVSAYSFRGNGELAEKSYELHPKDNITVESLEVPTGNIRVVTSLEEFRREQTLLMVPARARNTVRGLLSSGL